MRNKIAQRESKVIRRGRYKKEWWQEVSLSKTVYLGLDKRKEGKQRKEAVAEQESKLA